MNQIFAQILQFLRKFTILQRALILLVFLGIISSIVTLILWANRPEYQVLYGDLKPEQASKIIAELRERKITFRLDDGGETIKIPAKEIPEMRLNLAEKGLTGDITEKGYDVFDEQRIGMTSFMQQLNMKRALEGELTKSINNFPAVKNCRVHLVLPEEKLFEEEQNGSASVVLFLEEGFTLKEGQIKGIEMLVANSVKGIGRENVIVVDSNGNMLSQAGEEGNASSAGSHWELRTNIENKLQQKVEKIVENIVGRGNTVVQVSAELNMDRIERVAHRVDPENVAVISEESQIETRTNVDTLSNNLNENISRENVITNYETAKIEERYTSGTGTIKRVSVAVLVNGKYNRTTDAEGKIAEVYDPRTQEELDYISNLVKGAVGFDENRGDLIEVQNLQFDRREVDNNQTYFAELERKELINTLITRGIIVLTIIIAFIMIRRLAKSSAKALGLPEPEEKMALAGAVSGTGEQAAKELQPKEEPKKLKAKEPEVVIDEDQFIMHLSPEAKARLKAKEKMVDAVRNFCKNNPEDASQLFRIWLTQKD
ncbi:MAG: flagellar M-ring protein FliF [Candidatus Marinimicrobia bacterium]|nr:flagellar M-ring protein FliF [Candidatus Neomarinimicrobiota bacterium]